MIKNYPTLKNLVPLFFLLCSFSTFSQTTVIIQDDFNSNFGNWSSGQNSKVFRIDGGQTPTYEGFAQVVLTGPTNANNTLTSNVLDLRLYDKVDVKFFLKNWNSSNISTVTLQYQAISNGSWKDIKVVTIGNLTSSTSPRDLNTINTYHAFYGTLLKTNYPPSGFSATSKFRFVYDITGAEQFVIDYITVTGTKFKSPTKGPGGVTASLETWLKADQVDGAGVVADGTNVNSWKDKGKGNNANVIDENNASLTNRPVYKNNAASNINFNPVVYFNNDPATSAIDYTNLTNKATLHGTAGYYTQEQYVVVVNDNPTTALNAATNAISVFTSQGNTESWDPDATGIGFGKYTARMDNEIISYCLGTTSETTIGYGVAHANTTDSYPIQSIGIINARNKSAANGQEIYYNAKKIDNKEVGILKFSNFDNKRYWLGRDQIYNGSFGGRIAEVITFSSRKTDPTERPKIESYLAIKYGITLGVNGTSQDYVNSAGSIIWDINTGFPTKDIFNYNIAGIGRDDASELNQKQSKSVNTGSLITIGLGEVTVTNSQNISNNKSIFATDKDFLVWGNNNGVFSTAGQSARTISLSGTTTTFTPVAKKWKIMESQNDVPEVIISIATSSLTSGIPLAFNEKHVLVVSDSENFANTDIIDVVPLTINGLNSEVWYDFDGTIALGTPKYFTIAKATRIEEKRRLNIAAGEFILGDNSLALNTTAFSVSAWILNNGTGGSFISKGTDYNFKINASNKVEIDWNGSTKITSINSIPDSKWHHIALTYSAGTATLYIDGILDSSISSLANPAIPINTYQKFTIGALYTNKSTIASFNGDIDEVRIWNSALSLTEIRFIMNQEIEVSGTNVKGEIIPKAITKDDIISLEWSKLKAYYDMNSFYGTTVEDNSENSYWARIKYLKKDKQIVEGQTAPLPYESAANDGAWDTPATWLNNADFPNSLSIVDGVTPIEWNIVKTSHNITSEGNKTLLGLIVNGTSTITAGNHTKIEVSHYLKLDGVIDLQGKSQLVQTLDSDLEPTSAGFIKRNQQGVGNKYSYNYWSSPVGSTGAGNNRNYTVNGVFKQGLGLDLNPNFINTTYKDIEWIGGYDGKIVGDQIFLARYWLWKFENGTGYGNWAKIIDENNSVIRPSQGFTVKGASAVGSGVQNYTFVGKPHNGNIAANSVLANNYFLVGNPYPSALDGLKFIADNKDVITGAIYFWEQSSGNNTHNLAGYTGGYSTLSGTGGVGPSVPPAGISGLGQTQDKYKVPKQFIPVGQGFYVIGKAGMSSAQPILFNNSQRGFHKEGIDPLNLDESTYLFKNGATTKGKTQFDHFNDNSNDTVIDEKLVKIRLGFNTTDKFHRQLLIGFMNDKATDGEDYGYDAKQIGTRANDMFFPINNSKFIIQGVGYFDVNKIYPLGIGVTIAGNVQFVLDEVLNLPSDVSICVFDKLTGETHNISKKTFEIELTPGTYLDRFALTFKMQKLVAEDVVAEVLIPAAAQPIIEGIHVFMNNATGELQIKNNSAEEITSIALYNYLGQTLKTWNSNFNIRTISLPISVATGVYLVQINTKTGNTVKKISVK